MASATAARAAAAATTASSCSTSGLISYLGYATFTVGVAYGLMKRQSVASSVSEARAAKIAALERTIAEKDAEIARLKKHD